MNKSLFFNENTKQNRLETSLNPNPKDWKIISKLAHRTFVPSTKESRDKYCSYNELHMEDISRLDKIGI